MSKLSFSWRHYNFGLDGRARGYSSISYFIANSLKLVNEIDLEIIDPRGTPTNDIVVHCCPAHLFNPYIGRTNILFSMWEAPLLSAFMLGHLRRAEHHIVPSFFCQNLWKHNGLSSYRVPLGLADDYIKSDYGRRLVVSNEGNPLRFLFVGSTQKRKGWHLIAPAWKKAFAYSPANVQLYMKTIAPARQLETLFGGKVIIDTRDLDPRQMLKLYESADVFVFPSYGEGFGLPPLEAMATGCLVISSNLTGLSDFINGETAVVLPRKRTVTVTYDGEFTIKAHGVNEVAEAMRLVQDLWGDPEVEDRRLNGVRMARRFTWSNTAIQLAEAVSVIDSKRQGSRLEIGEPVLVM